MWVGSQACYSEVTGKAENSPASKRALDLLSITSVTVNTSCLLKFWAGRREDRRSALFCMLDDNQ